MYRIGNIISNNNYSQRRRRPRLLSSGGAGLLFFVLFVWNLSSFWCVCPSSGSGRSRGCAACGHVCVCVHLSSRICQLSTPSTQSPQAFCYYHPHPQNRTMGSEYSPWISFAMMVSSSSVTSNKYHHGGSSGSGSSSGHHTQDKWQADGRKTDHYDYSVSSPCLASAARQFFLSFFSFFKDASVRVRQRVLRTYPPPRFRHFRKESQQSTYLFRAFAQRDKCIRRQ